MFEIKHCAATGHFDLFSFVLKDCTKSTSTANYRTIHQSYLGPNGGEPDP